MKLLVIGVNHKTAPIALREQLAFADDQLPTAYTQLKQITNGSVIVSTCNRTEIYALAPDENEMAEHINHHSLDASIQQIKTWLASFKSVNLSTLEPYLYIHQDSQALTHWIRVAAGLDSMILGEPQILGQIKQAVNRSLQLENISNKMSWMIDQVFGSAKQVRHDTKVGSQAVTLGFATAKLATQIFDNLSDCTFLLVAAGEMNRLVANHIAGLGVGRIIIANRNSDRAINLATELSQINPNCQIETIALDELANRLHEADIVSSCSGSMNTLIDFKMTKQAVKKRRYRPMLMVDLAVPRDIEEKVNRLDEVYLYSIDDLQHVIAGNIEQRRQAAVDAELMVSQLVVDIERRFQVRQVGGDILAYRTAAQTHAQQLLNESLQTLYSQNLQQGEHSEQQVEALIRELTYKLTQTLTHAPSKLMRELASHGDTDTMDMVVTTLNEAYRKGKGKSKTD